MAPFPSRSRPGDRGLRLRDTAFLKRLYILFFLELASRRILFTACGEHPGGAWAAQQARNLTWQFQEAEVRPRFLIHDRDSNFPAAFDVVFRSEGLEVIRTPLRAPNANSRCERWVSSVRRECLDRLLIMNRQHLEAVLAEYVEHYNRHRPHRSLELRPPRGPTVIPASYGRSSGPPDARARADQRVFAAGCLTEHGAAADPDATPWARNASVGPGTSSNCRPDTSSRSCHTAARDRQRWVSTELGFSQAQPLHPRHG